MDDAYLLPICLAMDEEQERRQRRDQARAETRAKQGKGRHRR